MAGGKSLFAGVTPPPGDGYHPSPKYTGGVANTGAATGPDDEGRGGIGWTPAPASSHVAMFRFYDVRLFPFLAKFPSAIGQSRSELEVKFKDKAGNPTSTYVYYFDSPDAGQTVFDKMAASPHPFGEVLHPLVIKAGVAYSRR